MVGFFRDYPYLLTGLAMSACSVAACVRFRRHRRAMLLSGILCTPFAFCSVLFVPEYWQPSRLVCYFSGPEDLLFSFSSGVLAWLAAAAWDYKRIHTRFRVVRILCVYACGTVLFLLFVFILRNAFLFKTMPAALLTICLLYGVLLPIRSELWHFSLPGGMLYCAGYTAFFSIIFAIFPQFSRQWNWDGLWGVSLLGVPLEEVAFAFAFGAGWPLAMAYAFDSRIVSESVSLPGEIADASTR